MSLLIDRLVEKYKSVTSYIELLLEIELNGTLAMLNYYFNENLQK